MSLTSTAAPPVPTPPAAPSGWERVLWRTGWLLAVVMVVHVAALVVTGGAVSGPVSLRKPATFAETGALMSWSVALALPWLRLGAVRRATVGSAVLAFGVGETTVMAVQAWRGVPSHYNVTTTFDAVLMRAGAAGLALVLVVGLVALLGGTRSAATPAVVVLGVRAGTAVLLLGCAVGFVMISNMSGVFQGQVGSAFGVTQHGYLGPSPATVGREHLLLRPHTDGGDLVLLHAVGVHGLPLLTMPAVLLARSSLSTRTQLRLVGAMVTTVLIGLAGLAVQAFSQRPWDALPPVAVVGLGLLALGYLAALATALVLGRRAPLRPGGAGRPGRGTRVRRPR